MLLLALTAAGCSWFDEEKKPLPGERIPVILQDIDVSPDPRIADLRVMLPPPHPNPDWPQAGGYPDHAMHHLAVSGNLQRVWAVDAGSGSSENRRLLTPPVVADGRVYTMDIDFDVSAFDAQTGGRLWTHSLNVPDDDDEAFGGGLAFAYGRLYVSTGYGALFALDARDGSVQWQKPLPGPVRGAPTVSDDRVFVVSIDNQLTVLNATNGEKQWSHSGLSESAGLLGAGSPAVTAGTVVVPYSSGELFALRIENGRPFWSDNLISVRGLDALSSLADIRGNPVIDRGLVLAVSHSGRFVAIDQRTGARAWERSIAGVETPWVAGNFVYVLGTNGELYCVTRRDGRIRWVQPLPRWADPEDKEDRIKWSGPVLAGDRLIVPGSQGEALSVSPYTGELLGRIELPEGVNLAPVVAGGTVYFLTDDGQLIAYR
ncbi:MAG: PQQ-binding-like beta-propeller repeat protein [Alphaproteobacteria bacterium]